MANPILFLPGTGLPEEFYFPLRRALEGYGHVVTWKYRHKESMVEACRRLGGASALFENLRSEVCFGPRSVQTSLLGLNPDDGISYWYERSQHRPGESAESLWQKTILVGHSQGAGHALLLSKKHRLGGVLMIAGPADSSDGELASWTNTNFQTPAEKKLLMIHQQDAGYRAVIAHAEQCGLRQWQLNNGAPSDVRGLALIDRESVPTLTAHGCLAGSQTWNGPPKRRGTFERVLSQAFALWHQERN